MKSKSELTEEQAREEKYHAAAGIAATILALGGGLVSYAVGTSGSIRKTTYRRGADSRPAVQH